MINGIEANDEEIDIKTILVFIKRNKKNLFKIFSLILFPSLIFVSQIKSKYKGIFKVEINRPLNQYSDKKFQLPKKLQTEFGENKINIDLRNIETQKQLYKEFLIEKKYLLLSVATLKPIYEEVEFNKKNSNEIFDFDGWFNSYLKANLSKNILSINVFGKDKKEILLTLNLIQKKYEELNSKHNDLDLFVSTSPLITEDIIPNKLALYFFTLISAFVIASALIFIIEKLSGIVYGLSECKKFIKLEFLETIFINNLDLAKKLLKRSLEEKQIETNLGVVLYKFRKVEKKNLINQIFLSLKKEIKVIEIQNEELIREIKQIIIFIPNGEITYDELEILNSYIKIYQDKIIGWLFVE